MSLTFLCQYVSIIVKIDQYLLHFSYLLDFIIFLHNPHTPLCIFMPLESRNRTEQIAHKLAVSYVHDSFLFLCFCEYIVAMATVHFHSNTINCVMLNVK